MLALLLMQFLKTFLDILKEPDAAFKNAYIPHRESIELYLESMSFTILSSLAELMRVRLECSLDVVLTSDEARTIAADSKILWSGPWKHEEIVSSNRMQKVCRFKDFVHQGLLLPGVPGSKLSQDQCFHVLGGHPVSVLQ